MPLSKGIASLAGMRVCLVWQQLLLQLYEQAKKFKSCLFVAAVTVAMAGAPRKNRVGDMGTYR